MFNFLLLQAFLVLEFICYQSYYISITRMKVAYTRKIGRVFYFVFAVQGNLSSRLKYYHSQYMPLNSSTAQKSKEKNRLNVNN